MTLDFLAEASIAAQIKLGGVTMGRILSCRSFAIIARSILLVALCASMNSAGAQTKPESSKAVLMGSQPISFEPNRGQASAPANFVVRAPGLAVSLQTTGLDLRLGGGAGAAARLGVSFVGGNSAAKVAGSELRESYTNYILGNDSSKWLGHIPNFGRVTYRGIYPGVDIAYYGNREQLEHDFILAPNADYRLIRMRLSGQQHLELQADGSLKVVFPDGNLSFGKPDVYQLVDGEKVAVGGRYVLIGKNEIGFEIGDYDRSETLVIDPILTYSTYLTHISAQINGVATDTQGNTYVVGVAPSSDFPAASNTQLCKVCPNAAVFVGKMNATGTAYIYSTFFGGSLTDQPVGIAVDQNGNAVVTGNTTSNDFPVKNPVQTIVPNNNNLAFITSLTADGSSLNYSSLLGGGTQQQNGPFTFVGGVAVDTNGNAYISGTTDSPAFPVTTLDVVTPAFPNNVAFVTKFLTSGAIGFSALLGDVSPLPGVSGGPTAVTGIAVDSTGSAYITGEAGGLWPTTAGAFQTTIAGASPSTAPFVTKLSADGTSVAYSTFLGDSGPKMTGITVNSTGDAFVTGENADSTFPTTANALQPTFGTNTCCAVFVSELNATGTQLLYSTFLYGSVTPNSVTTSTSGIALDGLGGIWVTGTTSDTSFPLVLPVQSTAGGFVSRFNPAGSQLTFSSFIGGIEGSFVSGIAIDANGKAHVAGTTAGILFTTPGVYISTVTAPPPNVEFLYGYAAVIDTSVAAPSLCFSQQNIGFGTRLVGAAASQTVTLTNCGNAQLVISGITSGASVFAIPATSNGCLQPIAINGTCTFTVTFTPTAAVLSSTTITIASNAAISTTQFFVSGAGSAPVIHVQPAGASFDPQFIGQTSPPQFIFVTNTGGVALHIDLVHTTISAGFAFTATGCSQPIQPQAFNSTCAFQLTYTASSAGVQTGTLNIVSDDPVNPVLTLPLSGMGFSVYPMPTLLQVSPPTVPLGSRSVALQVSGSNFFPASVVYVGGVAQPTTYVSSEGLTATVTGSTFASLGEFPVTVFNPAPGGGESAALTLTSYQTITMSPTALVYNPTTSLLYAAIGSTATTNPNTVAVVDPVAGTVKQFVTVGSDPEKLALSGDGQFLYVGENGASSIQRINTSTLTIDETMALPSLGEPPIVSDLKVVPGSPNSVVVALGFTGGGNGEAGIALFTSGALVNFLPPASNQNFAASSFDFAGTPPVVYSLPLSTGGAFGVFTIDSAGIHLQTAGTSGTTFQTTGSIVKSDGTLLYTNSGQIWNPSPQTLVGTYNPSLFFAASVIPSTATGRTFFLDPFGTVNDTGSVSVDAYNQTSLMLTGSVSFLSSIVNSTSSGNLALWGTNGFAFTVGNQNPAIGSNQLIIFRSSISGTAVAQNPFPSLASLGISSTLSGGPSFSLSVTGSNFITGSTVQWNGTARTTTFVSATQLNAAITAADIAAPGTALVTVSNPAPGGGVSSPLTFTILASPPAATLSTASLTFAGQLVSSTSAAQTVMLTNPGGTALSITGIQATGDFAQTNNCGTSLASLASCTISVTFTPTATGTRTGSITITDSAANSPQVITLTGTGTVPDFTFPTGSNVTTATVTAGQTANYSLSLLASATFNGTVNLTCGNMPVNAHCTVTPTSIVLTSGKASTFTLAVATSSSTTLSIQFFEMIVVASCFAGLIALPFAWGRNRFPRLRKARAYGFAIVMVAFLIIAGGMIGCGGGGTPPPPAPTTTLPGTYAIQVSGSDGTTTQTLPLTLVVQ
jgi:hypothetical protein